jgi:Na+/melibiose symporter-like transporter
MILHLQRFGIGFAVIAVTLLFFYVVPEFFLGAIFLFFVVAMIYSLGWVMLMVKDDYEEWRKLKSK